MSRVRFLDDPAEFLALAADRLAAEPAVSMVVSRVTTRARDDAAAGVAPDAGVPRWWAVLLDGGHVVGLAMRTAPFSPFPLYVLPMGDADAVTLARALHERGEPVTAANGALPAVRVLTEETARLTGGTAEVVLHMRLFELGDLVEPEGVPGELRPVGPDEVDLAHSWLERFMEDADEQAGRPPGVSPHEAPSREELARRVARGGYWFWVDGGRPVHLTAGSAPAFGVSGIGPVFTPREARGRGYASAAVGAVSRLLRDQGARVCLFTDQANPTSNRIYERLGYRPLTDMANMVVRAGPAPGGAP